MAMLLMLMCVTNEEIKTNPENNSCSQQCLVEKMSAASCYLMQSAAVPHSSQRQKMHSSYHIYLHK